MQKSTNQEYDRYEYETGSYRHIAVAHTLWQPKLTMLRPTVVTNNSKTLKQCCYSLPFCILHIRTAIECRSCRLFHFDERIDPRYDVHPFCTRILLDSGSESPSGLIQAIADHHEVSYAKAFRIQDCCCRNLASKVFWDRESALD